MHEYDLFLNREAEVDVFEESLLFIMIIAVQGSRI